jgi:tetratricopeptide (TPR) repeat protein
MRAAAFLLMALAGQQPTPEQLFHDAVAAQGRGDDTIAIRDYRELLKVRPDVVEVHANLGAALAHAGRFDEAIAEYKVALTKAPNNAALRMNLALAYYKKNDWQNAANELAFLNQSAPDAVKARVVTLLGDCYSHLNRDKDAIGLLEPLVAAQPDNLDLAWVYGRVLIHAGRTKEGLLQAERVAQRGNSAEAYLLAGQTALELNEFERAKTDGDAAQKINAQLPGLQTLRGRTLVYLGDDAGAKTALEAALRFDPKDFDAHLTLGAMLNTERDLPNARLHLDEAIKLNPNSTLARYELARVERSQGELEKAARDFETVIQVEPKWLLPHVELAALYFKLKRPQDGQKEREIVDRLTEEQEKKGK